MNLWRFPYDVPLEKAVHEHATVRFGFESFAIYSGAKSYGHQKWTSHNKNRGGGIRQWCLDFCSSTRRHSSNQGPPTDLWKGNGCLFEHPKIQSHGGRLVGYIDKHIGHPTLSGITLLGFRFTSTLARSGNVTWSRVTGKVKALARDVYGRDLCLTQHIQYVHTFFLSKIWHTAQIFPASKEHERQLLTAVSCYIDGVVQSSGCLYQPYNAERRMELWTWSMSRPNAMVSFLPDFGSRGKGMCRWLLSVSMYGLCYLPRRTPHTYMWSLEPCNIYAFIFTNGHVWNPRGRPKHRGNLNDGRITLCELCLLRRTNHGRCVSCSFSQLLTGH